MSLCYYHWFYLKEKVYKKNKVKGNMASSAASDQTSVKPVGKARTYMSRRMFNVVFFSADGSSFFLQRLLVTHSATCTKINKYIATHYFRTTPTFYSLFELSHNPVARHKTCFLFVSSLKFICI